MLSAFYFILINNEIFSIYPTVYVIFSIYPTVCLNMLKKFCEMERAYFMHSGTAISISNNSYSIYLLETNYLSSI